MLRALAYVAALWALALVFSGVAAAVTPRQAATLLHSGGPKTTSVVCHATARKNVFACDVHLVRPLAGHRCVSALFLIPDLNVRDVHFSAASIRACDRGSATAAHPPLGA